MYEGNTKVSVKLSKWHQIFGLFFKVTHSFQSEFQSGTKFSKWHHFFQFDFQNLDPCVYLWLALRNILTPQVTPTRFSFLFEAYSRYLQSCAKYLGTLALFSVKCTCTEACCRSEGCRYIILFQNSRIMKYFIPSLSPGIGWRIRGFWSFE